MGSLAALLKDEGYEVTGSDQAVYPPMSDFLSDNGIPIKEGFSKENLSPKPDLVVVGNVISRGNAELEAALDMRLPYLSLPETLKEFFLRDSHNLVVTGTHGKTTTTSILAWLFEDAGKEPSHLIGGIPLNLGQGCRSQKGKHWVIEGDEYDTAFFDKRSKFLHYLPELVIINNIEFDHADIFNSLDEIKLSFQRLVNIIPQSGMVLVNADDPVAVDVSRKAHAEIVEVGFSENAGVHLTHFTQGPEGSSFEMMGHTLTVPLYGRHNVRNTAMASAAAHYYGISLDQIKESLLKFKGVKRRLEVRHEGSFTLVDDFGHHPTALRETLTALRHKYPNKRLWAIFEPRSNTTRRAVFQNDLPEALGLADAVVVSEVARLDQLNEDERLNPEKLIEDIKAQDTLAFYEPTPEAILERLKQEVKPDDVVGIFSNGGFGGLIGKILDQME